MFELIGNLPMFASLSHEEMNRLFGGIKALELPPQTILFREGDYGDCFYIVLEGELEVIKAIGTREERLLNMQGPGNCFGEVGLLGPERDRSATVRTRTPARLLQMTKQEFDELLQHQPIIAFEIARTLCRWLHDSDDATIRDLRQKNQELAQAFADLQSAQAELIQNERFAVLGKMASHISHEIKNPLMLIGGFTRQVLNDLSGDLDRNRHKLGIVLDEVRRLEEFLTEVGGYARFAEPQLMAGNLNDLIEDIYSRLQPALLERNINIQLNLAPHLGEVAFDSNHLRQVILNLAKNAVEAMESGGHLNLATGQKEGRAFFQVSDTGTGIAPASVDKVFEPFYTSKPKGTGLGLAITKRIVEAHNGEILIETEPEKGTSVTVFLNLGRHE